jgi:ketosteroid isomerase-like protein
MPENNAVLDAEQAFFDALLTADATALNSILAEDFTIIDVMTGSEILRTVFVDAVTSGLVKFKSIDRLEANVRFYGSVAIVTGRTEMGGALQGQPFGAASRYTHVFFKDNGRWKMVAAQGTPISNPS